MIQLNEIDISADVVQKDRIKKNFQPFLLSSFLLQSLKLTYICLLILCLVNALINLKDFLDLTVYETWIKNLDSTFYMWFLDIVYPMFFFPKLAFVVQWINPLNLNDHNWMQYWSFATLGEDDWTKHMSFAFA